MTSAARLVNLTQAAVSQQIKRLEDTFRRQLFERDRRGLRLTPSGERLLVRARRLLALNDEVWALMTAPDPKKQCRLANLLPAGPRVRSPSRSEPWASGGARRRARRARVASFSFTRNFHAQFLDGRPPLVLRYDGR
jgi:hypothetical protein